MLCYFLMLDTGNKLLLIFLLILSYHSIEGYGNSNLWISNKLLILCTSFGWGAGYAHLWVWHLLLWRSIHQRFFFFLLNENFCLKHLTSVFDWSNRLLTLLLLLSVTVCLCALCTSKHVCFCMPMENICIQCMCLCFPSPWEPVAISRSPAYSDVILGGCVIFVWHMSVRHFLHPLLLLFDLHFCWFL